MALKHGLIGGFLAAAPLVPFAPLMAQEASTEAPPPATGAVERLALAHDLFALGRAHGDSLTVLAAAKLAAPVATVPGRALVKTSSGPSAGEEEAPDPLTAVEAAPADAPAPADSAAMFAQALELAGQDEFLAGIVIRTRDTPAAPVTGAFAQQGTLSPGWSDRWEVPLTGGAPAGIAVIGAGGPDLDISVRDAAGALVCFDGGPEDRLYCGFTPAADGVFLVEVQNNGEAPGRYDLVTN